MSEVLLGTYDGLVCDLDGVVYAGPSAIEHAVEALGQARSHGARIVYATNNASRPPADVADHLRALGLDLADEDVINSSMAAASVLADSLDAGAPVLAVGGAGVGLALGAAGFEVIRPGHDGSAAPLAVVQGYGPDVRAGDLAEAAYAIQGGARWVATNTDATLPTDRGVAPGNGSLVAAVRLAVDEDPQVAGKPMPVMYDMAAGRMGVEPTRVLAIGDRLETDVEGAGRGGYDSVLVLTGVHRWVDAAGAVPVQRPTYVLRDLRGLHAPYDTVPVTEPQGAGRLSVAEARGYLQSLWAQIDVGALTRDAARERMERIEVAS